MPPSLIDAYLDSNSDVVEFLGEEGGRGDVDACRGVKFQEEGPGTGNGRARRLTGLNCNDHTC